MDTLDHSPTGQKRETMRINRKHEPMSDEQIQKVAPAAFAGQAHESRSEKYAFIPTVDILAGMRAHGFVPVYASQSSSRVAGKEFFTKHQIRFQALSNPTLNLGDVTAEIILTASHDGTSADELSCGLYRLACLNGMMVATSFIESLKVRHTGNALNDFLSGAEDMVKRAPVVIEAVREWKQIILTDEESLILAEEALGLRYDEAAPITADKLLTVRRNADQGSDLWTVFNRIQENTTQGGFRYKVNEVDPQSGLVTGNTRRAKTREVRGISESTKLNRALFSLAAKMKELKSGK